MWLKLDFLEFLEYKFENKILYVGVFCNRGVVGVRKWKGKKIVCLWKYNIMKGN